MLIVTVRGKKIIDTATLYSFGKGGYMVYLRHYNERYPSINFGSAATPSTHMEVLWITPYNDDSGNDFTEVHLFLPNTANTIYHTFTAIDKYETHIIFLPLENFPKSRHKIAEYACEDPDMVKDR